MKLICANLRIKSPIIRWMSANGSGWACIVPAATYESESLAMQRQFTAALTMVLAITMYSGAHAAANTKAATKHAVGRNCTSSLECLLSGSAGNLVSAGIGGTGNHATAEVISWPDAPKYTSGSIVIRTPERRLYYVLGDGKARRYMIGVGREGFQWSGTSRIVAKREWPEWRPPQEMIKREAAKGHILPEEMAGGPHNPLGARAMYIEGTMYRIHGNNDAASIGGATSSGCIRMMNADVIDLYGRVKIGTPVYVFQ